MKQRLTGFPAEKTVRRELADVFEKFDVQKKKQENYRSIAGKYREEFEGIIYIIPVSRRGLRKTWPGLKVK